MKRSKALVFVSVARTSRRAQHDRPCGQNPDGFYYTAAAGRAGRHASQRGARYGSMTYAGLKSMIYAGVGPDDPRVKAALPDQKNYDVKANPTWATPNSTITTRSPRR